MHDPKTVAFEIKNPFSKNKYESLLTIWHVDPENDGTDDSCGWFKRARHGDQEVLKKIIKEYEFNFKNNYWFDKNNKQVFSTSGTLLNMYQAALWIVYKADRKKVNKFLNKNLVEILLFAENPSDSMNFAITGKYGFETPEHYANIIYADILRKNQKWYQHPRWHINHWELQFHPLQNFKRRYFDKCCICGKRGFKSTAMSDWYGSKIWHQECDKFTHKPPIVN